VNLEIGHKEVPIKIIRTDRRKTATIKIVEGDVHVIVPRRLSQKLIEELIKRKTNWIRQKLHLQASIQPVRPKEYVSGEAFSYLGKNYRLKLSEGNTAGVKLKGGRFMLEVKSALTGEAKTQYVQAQLAQWYRDHAEQRLRDKAKRFAPLLGVSPNSINVKYFKARWGSCSIHGDVTFNWRIIMAPHQVVDYVVVHELAHLKHHALLTT
jgi:predicted metal-dependent hydrolase